MMMMIHAALATHRLLLERCTGKGSSSGAVQWMVGWSDDGK